MSNEHVETLARVFEAWSEERVEDVLHLMAEGLEWLEMEGGQIDHTGVEIRGRDEVLAMLGTLDETWEEYRLEPEEIRAAGEDRVVAVLREIARGRASGLEVTSRWGYLVTFRDGKVARFEAYRDPDQALEAAGLSA